jgi:pre-rRNA-processing protein IPI1
VPPRSECAHPLTRDPSQKIARTLHPVLLSAYLDAAPSAFAPGGLPSDHDLGIVSAVTAIAHVLYGALLRRPIASNTAVALDDLQTLLGHMSPHFPFRAGTGAGSDAPALSFCALAALLALRRPKARVHARRVAEYVVRVLDAGAANTADGLARPVGAHTYGALVPTVWALANGDEGSADVVRAVLEHALRVPATSATSALAVEFVARLVLVRLHFPEFCVCV